MYHVSFRRREPLPLSESHSRAGCCAKTADMRRTSLCPKPGFLSQSGDLDPVLAAPLTDAGITTYSAIKPALPAIWPGSTAVVIGVGGLGLYAVQFLRQLTSARVVAVDRSVARLKLAREYRGRRRHLRERS